MSWLMCPSLAERGHCLGLCRLSGWRAALFSGHEGRRRVKDRKHREATTNGRDRESAELLV